jgi:2-oxoisovalerate dehydrogenase E1 component
MRVVRLSGHTLVDDQAYKTPVTLAAEAAQDPLVRLREYLDTLGIDSGKWEKMSHEVDQEVSEALLEVEALPDPAADKVTSHLFYQGAAPVPCVLKKLQWKKSAARPTAQDQHLIPSAAR